MPRDDLKAPDEDKFPDVSQRDHAVVKLMALAWVVLVFAAYLYHTLAPRFSKILDFLTRNWSP